MPAAGGEHGDDISVLSGEGTLEELATRRAAQPSYVPEEQEPQRLCPTH